MPGMFDVARVPFSYAGSYMMMSVPRKEQELFFRNCHGGPNDLFPLQVLAGGEVIKPEIEAQPWVLVLRHGEGRIEICFESAGTVRMRGQGIGLRFGGKNLAYAEGPGRVTLNKPRTRRYGVEMLRGGIALRRQVPTQPIYPVHADVSPAEDGGWELAIDEFWSTWRRPDTRRPFDECVAAARASYETFCAAMPEARPQDETARRLAAYVDWSCTVGAYGLLKRPALLMSKNWMCNVWSWDHCFNAMALAAGRPELALDQMLVMVDHQDEFGSYPDSVNAVWKHYNFSKPPVHGWAFSEMLRRLPERPPAAVMETMYRSLGAQANWWMTYRRMRDAPGELVSPEQKTGGRGDGVPSPVSRTPGASPGGAFAETDLSGGASAIGNRQSAIELPYYLHGNDSGWDNSTMFDRGVPLVAPDLAALLVVQMDVLSDLARELGKGDEATDWKQRADALFEALMSGLWRGDRFVARLAETGEDVESKSLIPWLPILLGERLPAEAREALKRGIEGHLTEWGLATERVDSERYDADGYWRGPIWGPSTCLAVAGLDRCGYTGLADTVSERFCRLCDKSGFAENYDAVTGASLCDPAYTWTASVFLLLAERMKAREGRSACPGM